MDKNIGPFRLYTKKPNNISSGYLYTTKIKLLVPFEKERILRVYLPKGYDENKMYRVIYMCDGQNIVDKYTTAYGEWDIDERMEQLVKEGYPPFVVVGVDCPYDPINRVKEYSLDLPFVKKYDYQRKKDDYVYSDLYFKSIVEIVKPLVEQYFSVSTNKEDVAYGGSSMGGAGAFGALINYPTIFGFGLCFSPAFHLYKKDALYEMMNNLDYDLLKDSRFYFYTGGSAFEALFLVPTFKMYLYLKNKGFNDDNLQLLVDTTRPHNEESWSMYFKHAIRFWMKNYALD